MNGYASTYRSKLVLSEVCASLGEGRNTLVLTSNSSSCTPFWNVAACGSVLRPTPTLSSASVASDVLFLDLGRFPIEGDLSDARRSADGCVVLELELRRSITRVCLLPKPGNAHLKSVPCSVTFMRASTKKRLIQFSQSVGPAQTRLPPHSVSLLSGANQSYTI